MPNNINRYVALHIPIYIYYAKSVIRKGRTADGRRGGNPLCSRGG